MRRFENFPIHKSCYYASLTTPEELARDLDLKQAESTHETTRTITHLVDPFGMTPFNVLLSAANCRMDLLQVLLDGYPAHILGWKDVNRNTAVEYLAQRIYLPEERLTKHAPSCS